MPGDGDAASRRSGVEPRLHGAMTAEPVEHAGEKRLVEAADEAGRDVDDGPERAVTQPQRLAVAGRLVADVDERLLGSVERVVHALPAGAAAERTESPAFVV